MALRDIDPAEEVILVTVKSAEVVQEPSISYLAVDFQLLHAVSVLLSV